MGIKNICNANKIDIKRIGVCAVYLDRYLKSKIDKERFNKLVKGIQNREELILVVWFIFLM